MLLFLPFQNNRKSAKKSRTGQSNKYGNDSTTSPQQCVVPKIHFANKAAPAAFTSKPRPGSVSIMGQDIKTPFSMKHEVTIRQFMLQLLKCHQIPTKIVNHIAEYGWRKNTYERYNTVIKKWMWYSNQEKTDEFDLSLNNLLSFLDFQEFDVKSLVK